MANGMVGRAQPVGTEAPPDTEPEPEADPRYAAADAALERGDFAEARDAFDKSARGQSERCRGPGWQGAGWPPGPRRNAGGPGVDFLAANGSDDLDSQLAAADVEMISGQAEAAFARLIDLVKRLSGDDRNKVRVRLLELFETLGNTDDRVLKARRDLMTALF